LDHIRAAHPQEAVVQQPPPHRIRGRGRSPDEEFGEW
jgi:hypothetical protein